MSTIIVINAVSSLFAAAAIGGYLVRDQRRSRKVFVKPLYVTTRPTRRGPPAELPRRLHAPRG
jgi:hypothetical protein